MKLDVPFNDHGLNNAEIGLLRKGNFLTVEDLLLTPTQDIAKRCKTSPIEIKRIVDIVLGAVRPPELMRLETLIGDGDEKFSTGDDILDNALGGGIRTGMVWEVVGESSAGKTQLALQLSLFVQAPRDIGGLSGSSCYLTTSSKLPTARLLQMCQSDETLASSFCGLAHVHTIAVPTVATLQEVLTNLLPAFILEKASKGRRPVKLVVIDALGELFHSNSKTTTSTLVERSKNIASISTILHELADVHRVAVVVLNEVIDRFDRPTRDQGNETDLFYETQSRWFNTAEFFGESKKEASLGLVWANQVNTRIMLTRTGRRKYLSDQDLPKRRRMNKAPEHGEQSPRLHGEDDQQSTLIRRLTVIFTSVASPVSLDYVVTERGITILPHERASSLQVADEANIAREKPVNTPSDDLIYNETTRDASASLQSEEENLWAHTDALDDFGWDALEQTLSEAA